MKILHLCLGCFYIDNYTYQENMIPKYHKKMGNEVYIVASTISFDENGNSCYVEPKSYVNEYEIPVIRLPYNKKMPIKIARFLRRFESTYETISNIKPELIFIHGCQFSDIDQVVKYLKHNKETKVFVDNHADFSNSARNWVSKNFLHKGIWKRCARKIEPFTGKFYGVLPARVRFLHDIYNIPEDKIELLVMGADDELVDRMKRENMRTFMRNKLGINESDFLIVTGGKVDEAKKQVLFLMEAIKSLKLNVKLIVFGSVVPALKQSVLDFCDNDKIRYVGWLNTEETYQYLAAADLAVYPGRHSVLWEQTVGLGIPMIVKHWSGTTHIDLNGNVKFLYHDSTEEIQNVLSEIICNSDTYQNMKNVATEKGMNVFSYRKIAKRCINQ